MRQADTRDPAGSFKLLEDGFMSCFKLPLRGGTYTVMRVHAVRLTPGTDLADEL